MNILVTGIHGFVGSNLVVALKERHSLYGLDIVAPEKEGVVKTFSWKDIEPASFPMRNLPEFDAIIHLAGKAHDTKNRSAAQAYFDINMGLTQKIFDFFLESSAKKFVFFSSVKAAADSVVGDMLTEDVVPAPVGPYGESKIAAENYILDKLKVENGKLKANPYDDKQVYILRPCMIHGSGNTVITKIDGLQKLSLRVPELLRPVFAVMNPELTYTLPPFQTACGIADMMAHIMERYFTNTKEVEIGDRLCEGTLLAIIKEAAIVMKEPENYGARANLMWCGNIAHNGTCGVGCEEDWASHFLEHEISAIYNVTHGAGLSVVFPAWMTWMTEHNVDKIAQYAVRVWNVSEADDKKAVALEGIARLKYFFKSIGLPVTFSELGIENPDIDRLADSLHRNKGELVGNYVKLTKEDSKEIYRLAL